MTPDLISKRVMAERISWVNAMLDAVRSLPLSDPEAFFSDQRNVSAAESCLRRALEALLDLGRHILAKGFGCGVTEYKEIAQQLEHVGVLDGEQGALKSCSPPASPPARPRARRWRRPKR